MKELVEIQNKLKAPKSLYNKFGEYNYRSCEDILEALKPLLFEHNCFLIICDDIVLVGDRYYVKATATIHNLEGVSVSNSAFAREQEVPRAKMDVSQTTGAASTYARKYALNGLFIIDDVKDSDHPTKQDEPQVHNGPQSEELPWLNEGDKNFQKVIDYLKNYKGEDYINVIRKKYRLSNKTRDKIVEIKSNLKNEEQWN